jgi:peptidoglycan hydrolase-like protein with peptidoglycan-binding domain
VRAIQQALFDLKLLRDKPDGALGPMTRNAIRTFQRGAGLAQTGEPSKDVYVALKRALAKP